MIQRVQTIWLLLAAITGFLFTRVPLYLGTPVVGGATEYTSTENLLLFALGILGALLALIAVFLFKNRKLQMKLTAFGILISVALIALEVYMIDEFGNSNPTLKTSYSWGSLLPIAMIIFFILAAVNIRKDEKLVKSLNRLR